MSRRPTVLALLLVLAAGAAAGCGGSARANDAGRLQVVTTVAPITSLAAAVAGDRADVRGVVPEGTSSHTFEPPPSVARTLARADVLFVNGLALEEPTRALARETLPSSAEVVALGERTIRASEHLYDFSFPRSGGKPNPHLWTNPPMAKTYARVIRDTLVQLDGANAAAYRANHARLASSIDALDAAMRVSTATVPVGQRRLLTYHDAYAYFAKEYGWTVIGAIQPSSFTEPTAREVGALIHQVKAAGVPAIFGSEVFPSPVLAQIGREAGVSYVDVLRDDDLPGEPGDREHSYLGLMRFDFATLVRSLGGDPAALDALDFGDIATDRASYPQ